ncbi:MAG: cytochrome c-type biogenesis protein [Alcanivoracaceae bacterium]|jgi:cytochrome c-type biogenesis protein CcmH|nr:cytochrome c-type biogenesis protein [Alcanivoracaceae bacterium]
MKRLLLLFIFCWPLAAAAVEDIYQFASAEDEHRFRELLVQLRCPKCQNQAIADSDAPISQDMREQVAAMIRAGHSDEEIVGYFVERYGDFVNYQPPLTPQTLILWLGPLLAMLAGALLVAMQMRRARRIARGEDVL